MPEVTRKLGRYELLRRIAEGGMGEIYLARQRGAGGFEKNLIIKTILPHLAKEEEFVEKFLDEGRTVVQLVHGNIVPVFDMGQEAGEYYIAMEYIAGRDLRDIQKRLKLNSDTMPIDLALFIVGEFCKGLDYAHRKTNADGASLEIVHRDVSPSNILISGEGEVKLIDFGIARATSRLGKTVTGRIQGKFCYMSPEQAAGKALDGRSDLFSAGVVLYELLTGHRPFEGDSDLESLDLVRRCEYDPPSTFNHDIDQEIDELVMKVLSRDPADRFASVDDFQSALLPLLYAQGRGPSSKNLGAYLTGLFPDGLEHGALKNARDSRPDILGAGMSLDDALAMQLDGLDSNVDPFHTTAISSASADATAPTAPTVETPQAVTPLEVTPARHSDSIMLGAEPAKIKGRKRALAIGLVLGMIFTIGGLIYLASADSYADTLIESSPPGAEIAIDGATLPGSKTPFKTSLEIGKREITLSLSGYEERKFILDVAEDKPNVLSSNVAELSALLDQRPRSISVSVIPSDAKLFVDDSEIGVGGGKILIQRNGLVKLRAKKAGCISRLEMVGYEDKRSEISITLDCQAQPKLTEPQENDVPIEGEKVDSTKKEIWFRTTPSGALVFNKGKKIGETPFRKTFNKAQKLSLDIRKPGYKGVSLKKSVAQLKKTTSFKLIAEALGCLNFSLGDPMIAKIAIDGQWLKGESGRLRAHPLPAGTHKVRVKNDIAKKDETFSVVIREGKKCTFKHVWKRK